MQIWRVNLRNQTFNRESAPETWESLGGRGLLARILLDEVPPTCDPLGPHNKLVFAPGLLVGHMLSSCDRLSVGTKSPLTGGIKESNAGGTTGMQMTLLDIKALILEDQPAEKSWWVLHLSTVGARFEPAGDLVGLGVFATAERLIERYGKHVAISLIGPGGEMQLLTAGIQNLDKDHTPSRINARGGVGAVMGSKGLKAIIFDAAGGKKQPLAHPEEFKTAYKTYTRAVLEHPQSKAYAEYGTAAMTRICDTFGALPTRNFSCGQFEGMEAISGETMRQTILTRGGKGDPSHACMPGCTIRCSNIYAGENGEEIVSPVEYETIGLMGSNLGIDSLDFVAKMNRELNDLGLDTIDIGAALGVAAEAGIMKFGDGECGLRLIEEIRQATPLGRILGHGAAMTGKVLGVRRVPVVKGQAISAYDPRAIKGTGVTYATSPMGADHTAGLTIRQKIDHLDPNIQIKASRGAQVNAAGYDTLGACAFAGFGYATVPTVIRDLLNARYGWQVGDDILQTLGKQTITLEREFNRRAGLTAANDRIPEWMMEEALAPTQAVFDVPGEAMDEIFDWS